jgi:hypothetical protein
MAEAAAPQEVKLDTANPEVAKAAADKAKEEKAKKGKQATADVLRSYLLPLAMLFSSVIIIIVILLPVAEQALNNLNEVSKLQGQYKDQQSALAVRQKLSSETNLQLSTLSRINSLIPQSQTAVVNFSESVRNKATQNRLEVSDSVVGEIVTVNRSNRPTNAATAAAEANLELVELPAEFTMRGGFENIRKFLSDLYGGTDFIIIKKMELQQIVGQVDPNDPDGGRFNTGSSQNWSLSLVLVKYQFRVKGDGGEGALRTSYFNVPDTLRADPNVVNFINENYGDSTSTTTPTTTP